MHFHKKNSSNRQYAFYFEGVKESKVSINLPAGTYQVELTSVENGSKQYLGRKKHKGGELKLAIPDPRQTLL